MDAVAEVTSRVDDLLDAHPPAATGPLEFLGAQFDFGLARINYGYALGTPGYMSPEQAMGLEVDRRSDVHALGLLAFELLTGHRPFMATSPVDLILATVYDPVPSARTLNPELPPELDAVLFRALAKNPADRQPSVFALLEEMHRNGQSIVLVTHDPTLAARATRTVSLVDGQIA